jgi:hypothetical protein
MDIEKGMVSELRVRMPVRFLATKTQSHKVIQSENLVLFLKDYWKGVMGFQERHLFNWIE